MSCRLDFAEQQGIMEGLKGFQEETVTQFSRWLNEIYTSAVSSDHAIVCVTIVFITDLAIGLYQWLGRDESAILSFRAEGLRLADEVRRSLGPR
jgi:hypothetical protein